MQEIERQLLRRRVRHPGKDPRAPTARWHKLDGEWVLLVSPVWKMGPGELVSVAKRGYKERQLRTLDEFVRNTGASSKSWLDRKDAFRPLGRAPKGVVRQVLEAARRRREKLENEGQK